MTGKFFLFTLLLTFFVADAGELYKKFQPVKTSRKIENVEWSDYCSYNARDNSGARVLVIGDSISWGYKDVLRRRVKNANFTIWASSKCVTDKNYFRELDFVLSLSPCKVICFNNGLHSLNTDRAEWEAAFDGAVRFIQTVHPQATLLIVNCTPLRDAEKTKKVLSLNEIIQRTAQKRNLTMVNLFNAMDQLDRKTNWSDLYHFQEGAKDIQAKFLAEAIEQALGNSSPKEIKQQGSETGPDGAIR